MSGPDAGLLVQDVVYAGLDSLRAALPLDLCAYLHASGGFGPQLYLRAPELSALDATEAFELFCALRDALEEGGEAKEAVIELGGFTALAVTTVGSRSRGLHVVGRRHQGLDDREHDTAAQLCRAVGGVLHALEAVATSSAGASTVTRVAVATDEAGASAEVAVTGPAGPRTGEATADSPTRAVALAVLAAVEPSYDVVATGDGDVAGDRAALVLVRDPAGHRVLAASLAVPDALQATATAALEAAERLRQP